MASKVGISDIILPRFVSLIMGIAYVFRGESEKNNDDKQWVSLHQNWLNHHSLPHWINTNTNSEAKVIAYADPQNDN